MTAKIYDFMEAKRRSDLARMNAIQELGQQLCQAVIDACDPERSKVIEYEYTADDQPIDPGY